MAETTRMEITNTTILSEICNYSSAQCERSREDRIKDSRANCGELANAWREVNTTYYGTRNEDAKQQGNYTKDGKLLVGYICG